MSSPFKTESDAPLKTKIDAESGFAWRRTFEITIDASSSYAGRRTFEITTDASSSFAGQRSHWA